MHPWHMILSSLSIAFTVPLKVNQTAFWTAVAMDYYPSVNKNNYNNSNKYLIQSWVCDIFCEKPADPRLEGC